MGDALGGFAKHHFNFLLLVLLVLVLLVLLAYYRTVTAHV